MRALPTYSRTKPTAIPWIGEVPEHWEVKQFKYFFREHGGNGFPHEDQGVDEGELPFFKVGDLSGRGKGVATTSNWTSRANALARNWNVVPKGAIISPKIGESLRKNNRKLALVDCLIDNNCVAHEPIDTDGDFAFFLLSLIDFDWYVNPGAVPSVSLSKLRGSTIAVPPLPEQTHIARYLSYKTALIDAYLARKRRMMALLKEQRQALISQAVTKGLDPNAPMKDSGVEWIGEVPEHWEVKRIKHLGTIDNSGCWGADEGEEAGLRPVSTTAHLTMDGLWLKDEMPVRWFTSDEIARYEGRIGDIIIVKSSGSAANIISGKAGIIGEDDEGMIFSNFLMRIRPTNVEPLFLYYFLTSHLTRERIEMMVSATTYPNLKVDEYFNHLIPLPDRKEQQAIVAFISDKLVQINDELTRIQTSMERVREYRQALISAVVTGKVDVRGVEVPEEDQMIGRSDDQIMEEESGMRAVDVVDEEV